jgi:uncharacterized protein YdhG (YjbR/CyaY superfamily)
MADHSTTNKTAEVDAFMAKLDHPFKAEVQAVREIIKGVNPHITEQIKWNAPSFSYKDYLATFLVFRGYAAGFRRLSRVSGNRSRMCWSG